MSTLLGGCCARKRKFNGSQWQKGNEFLGSAKRRHAAYLIFLPAARPPGGSIHTAQRPGGAALVPEHPPLPLVGAGKPTVARPLFPRERNGKLE